MPPCHCMRSGGTRPLTATAARQHTHAAVPLHRRAPTRVEARTHRPLTRMAVRGLKITTVGGPFIDLLKHGRRCPSATLAVDAKRTAPVKSTMRSICSGLYTLIPHTHGKQLRSYQSDILPARSHARISQDILIEAHAYTPAGPPSQPASPPAAPPDSPAAPLAP